MHYQLELRRRTHGILSSMKTLAIPLFDHFRLLSKVSVVESGCWEWQGYKKKSGYGEMSINNKLFIVHRLSYSVFKKPIDENLVIDHICRNRSCINPEHLREVTQKENVLENSLSIQSVNSKKTHCKNGHEFSVENMIYNPTGRECKICRYFRSNSRRRNKRLCQKQL